MKILLAVLIVGWIFNAGVYWRRSHLAACIALAWAFAAFYFIFLRS